MRHEWTLASNVMSWLAALQGVTVKPEKLNPLAEKSEEKASSGEAEIHIGVLKTVFVDQQPGVAVQALLNK